MEQRLLRLGLAAVTLAALPASMAAQELTLEATLRAGLSQHPLIEAARARVDAARGDRVSASALLNPIATLWIENAPLLTPRSTPSPLRSETSAYVTLPLEPLLQRAPRTRRADEDVKHAEASLALARRHVALEAARAFFRVALAQELADEAEENWATLDQLAAYNRARVDEGITAEGELLRIQVELDRAATELAFAGVELTRRRAELAPFLGSSQVPAADLDSIRVVVPDGAVPSVSSLPARDLVLARAREQRPEMAAARARVAAAAASTDYERTLSVRQLGATVGSKRVEGQHTLIAGVAIAVPLFNRNNGGVQRATSERLAAEQELAWAERTVSADVQGAVEAATQLIRQLSDLQVSLVARAEQVQQLTLGAYQESGATLLQVLDATRLLADARLTRARSLIAQRQSLFELALAAGTEPIEAAGATP